MLWFDRHLLTEFTNFIFRVPRAFKRGFLFAACFLSLTGFGQAENGMQKYRRYSGAFNLSHLFVVNKSQTEFGTYFKELHDLYDRPCLGINLGWSTLRQYPSAVGWEYGAEFSWKGVNQSAHLVEDSTYFGQNYTVSFKNRLGYLDVPLFGRIVCNPKGKHQIFIRVGLVANLCLVEYSAAEMNFEDGTYQRSSGFGFPVINYSRLSMSCGFGIDIHVNNRQRIELIPEFRPMILSLGSEVKTYLWSVGLNLVWKFNVSAQLPSYEP